MRRTATKQRRTPAKKQSSILSFFSTGPAQPAPSQPFSNSNIATQLTPATQTTSSPSPRRDTTPSTTLSNDERVFSTRSRTAAESKTRRQSRDDEDELRKELFLDADDEDVPIRRLKRRRVQTVIDEADDDGGEMRSPSAKSSQRMDLLTSDQATKPSILEKFLVNKSPRLTTTDGDNRRRGKSARRRRDDDCASDEYIPEEEPSEDEDENEEGGEFVMDGEEDRNAQQVASSSRDTHPFDFVSLKRVESSDMPHQEFSLKEVPLTQRRKQVREKLGALDASSRAVGSEEGGWCAKHPWTVNIRDAQRRAPDHPDYDKTTLYVPTSELNEMRGPKYGGLSPFQRQFWSIKKENYDIIIFFKKGKFYELYDVDADVGHKVLGLNFTKGGRVDMRCCGVPEQALDKHCARLIDLGYKVGRVEQTETANAAEKRKNGSSSNKSSVCERSLVRILTRGTVTGDSLLRDHRARYVLAVTEEDPVEKMTDSDKSTSVEDWTHSTQASAVKTVGVCYVDVASGSINISQFEDDFRLSKTERLITFLRPQELLVDLARASERLANISKWCSRKSEAELYDLGRGKGFRPMTESWLAQYFNGMSLSETKAREFKKVCAHMKLYPLSCTAFGAMASHLKALIIDSETLSMGNYDLFPRLSGEHDEAEDVRAPAPRSRLSSARLRMDAPTLQNLEVLSSSVDASEKGSLLSFVDKAHTPAGRRLLRRWLAEPLVSAADIEDRLQAVEDIHAVEDEDGGRTLRSILRQLKTKKDMERALPKLHRQATIEDTAVMFDDTNKRRVKDFVLVLRGLQQSLCAVETLAEALERSRPKSKRLEDLCGSGKAIPSDAIDKLNYFLGSAFDLEVAESTGDIVPKEGAIPAYDSARRRLDDVESHLQTELKKWQTRLGDKSIKYYHRGKEPYQIEVKLDTIRGRTPDEFEVVSESKGTKRFYTRRVKKLVRDQVEASEAFDAASSSVARDMMRQFDSEHSTWFAITKTCAELDALIGLAFASRDEGNGSMCRPTVLGNDYPQPVLSAEGLRHPILATKAEFFVANDVSLGGGREADIMILTGPNAGGKSTLSRQIALAVILAQTGCFVPAESFALRPFEDIYVRMGATDDLARGRSTFMVEMEEVSNILNNATGRSLVIADEVGRGTSTHDGYAVAYATLDHIARVNKSLTVFSTHYSHLGEDIVGLGAHDGRLSAALFEMAANVDERNKKITFLYKLQRGSSGHSRGVYCARVAGIPSSVAEEAEKAAVDFDKSLEDRLKASKFSSICLELPRDGVRAAQLLRSA